MGRIRAGIAQELQGDCWNLYTTDLLFVFLLRQSHTVALAGLGFTATLLPPLPVCCGITWLQFDYLTEC